MGYLMCCYECWLVGEEELKCNECDQLGICLMYCMGLDIIYGCDVGLILYDINNDECFVFVKLIFEEMFKDYDW